MIGSHTVKTIELAALVTLALLSAACGESDEEKARRIRDENSKKHYGDPNTPGSKAHEMKQAAASCDQVERKKREVWMRTPINKADGSPQANGYRISGACGDTLEGKGLSCDERTVQEVEGGGGGWLAEALSLGFTTYVCVEADGGKRHEFPLGSIVNALR